MKKLKLQRNHNPLIRLCIYVFAAYVAVSLITLQMQINEKKEELQQVQKEYDAQYVQQKELERQLELGDNDDHMARIAQDKLDMGFPDEHVYRDISGS